MKHVTWGVAAAIAVAGALGVHSVRRAGESADELLHHERRLGQWRQSRRPDGADAHCQNLAKAAGAGNRQWRAYLSTQGAGAVNAKDRIGAGPWVNSKGVQVAANVAELHSRQEQPDQGNAAHREGNRRQRAR